MNKLAPFLTVILMGFAGQAQRIDTALRNTSLEKFPPQPNFTLGVRAPVEVGWINFAQFNPAGDGKTDDSPKLIQALTYCSMLNIGLEVDPTKTYLLATPVSYQFAGRAAIRSAIQGRPVVFYLPDSQLNALTFSATAGTFNTKLAAEVRQGDRTLTLAGTTGLHTGDLIVIQSNVDWPIESGTKKGEFNVVESISGNTVVVRHSCQDSYTVSEVPAVTNFLPARLELQDIDLRIRKTGNRSVIGLTVSHMQHSKIERVTIANAQYASSQFYGCYDTEIANCRFENANEEGEGYGIATVGGLLYQVHHNRSFGCRKLCDFSSNSKGGPTRNSRAFGNEAWGEGITNLNNDLFTRQSFCIATHGGAEGILIQDNTAMNCSHAFQLRGRDITLNNNRILGKSVMPIALSAGQNHIITNNIYQSLLTNKTAANGPAVDYAAYPNAVIALSETLLPVGYIIIKNNTFDFVRNYAIYAANVRQRCLIQHNHVEFNTLGGGESDPVVVFWDKVTTTSVGLRVRDNTYQFNSKTSLTNLMYVARDPEFYPVGSVIDWPSCEVQGLRASDVLTLTDGVEDAPYQQYIKGLSVTKMDDNFSLSGNFDFTFQTATQPMLSGLPLTNTQTNKYFTFSVEPDDAVYTGKVIGSTGQAVFGAQSGVFGKALGSNTHYFINLDLRYQTH